MYESARAWIHAHAVDLLTYAVLAWISPAVLQVLFKPPEGSKAFALIGTLAAWGFDPEKFARRLREVLAKRGPPPFPPLLALALVLVPGCAWFRSPAVVEAGELVLHAADSACGVVALLHDDQANAVCLVVHELDALDAHLAKAETAEADAPLVVVAKDTSSRTVRVRREHVKRARAAVKVARGDVTP